ARVNSGVILYQLIRGFGKVSKSETALKVPVLADAFDRAVETAYKAVMKPKEGTILTVAKGAAVKSRELADAGEENLEVFLGAVLAEAEKVLASTPELLPVLKQAGVVDSGGQGLVQVMKGAYDRFLGKEIDYSALMEKEEEAGEAEPEKEVEKEQEYLRFIYKMRMTILMSKKPSSRDQKEYIEFLKSLGDRVKCAAEGDILHVRIQTNDPGLIIQRSQKFGELGEVRLINLKEAESGRSAVSEKEESKAEPAAASVKKEEPVETPPQPRKEVGFITVSVGEGIEEIFKGLGVDYVISGGQTMNPSTDDVLKAVEKVNADTIFVLPNNKNIIMAANQAASLTEDKKVVVVPTTTVPQGITAVINYMPDLDAEANKANMTEEIGAVHSAEVTYAVRDTEIDGIKIHEGDIMAIGDQGILTTGKGIEDITFESLTKIVEDDTEIISIYYGKDVSEEDAEKLRKRAVEAFSSCDVELQYGGQPIYYYILSAE
ncbi:MAG: DAK2 domain-containing protein, partial [Lachnospiraceae bacterium]|nr:DAK2 domain-containing protein [Lachnospiraceae bacterium]